MRSSARGLTTAALALAGALSLAVAGPHRAYAAPGATASQADADLAITVLSPTVHASFTGNKPIEVSAFYQGSDLNQISSLELYVDGSNAFTKRLDSPESRGVISFLIDASQLTPGAHKVVVRAVAVDAEVVSAKTSFIYVSDQPRTDTDQSQPQIDTSAAPSAQSGSILPELSYMTPKADDQVQGTVKISLKASEPDGKAPYVSLFIDHTFKTLRNYAPYEYDWDTTSYTNGYHTIEAYGYDENQNVGPAQVVRVYVNNPGGHTQIRKDLQDGVPAKPTSLKTASKSAPYRITHSAETKAVHSAIPTKPIDEPEIAEGHSSAAKRISPLKPMQVAELTAISDKVAGNASGLSDPFVTTSGNPVGSKVMGMARRPSPRMAMLDGESTKGSRQVMMAKRMDVLDETGGLHSTSDLSDPFIPATATPKPAARTAITPTNGFKPMPKGPALASSSRVKLSPALITRDAHTVPAQSTAPQIVQPSLDLAVKAVSMVSLAPAAKTVKVQTPAVKPAHIEAHVSAPVAKTLEVHTSISPIAKKLEVHSPAVTSAKRLTIHTMVGQMPVHRIAVHTGGVASLMRARGEMKVLFNHTSLRLDRPLTPRAGVMFGPLRQIFEYQGGTLTWDRKTGTVHAQSDNKDIVIRIGQKSAVVNKQSTALQMAPYLDDGRTMVPLSFLPSALDVNVQFDKASGHVLITTKN